MSANENQKYVAVLKRGNVYTLRDTTYTRNVPRVIDDAIFDHLTEHAVDYVGGDDGEVDLKPKFEFHLYDGDLPVGAVIGKDRSESGGELERVNVRDARQKKNRLSVFDPSSVEEEDEDRPARRAPPAPPRNRARSRAASAE